VALGLAAIGKGVFREHESPEQAGAGGGEGARSERATLAQSSGKVGRWSLDLQSARAGAQSITKAATASHGAGVGRLFGRLPDARGFIPPQSLLG
jgi:hypothetical protein